MTVWSVCFNYLIYKPQNPDEYSDSFVLINLKKGGTRMTIRNFTPDSTCKENFVFSISLIVKYLAYANDVLYVANSE